MIVLLSGQIKNIGDFLITERARLLFEKYVDEDIVILNRTKDLEPNLELINKGKLLVLCGGPAYTSDIYQGIYPLVNSISKIRVPIIPFGLGWCGRPIGMPMEFKFDEKAHDFLTDVHDKIKNSSCRCDITKSMLNNNGFQNVTMTGCPVWYDLPSVGKEFEEKKKIEHIVFTTAADPKLIGQTWRLIKILKRQFPKARVTMSYHRGIMPDKHTTIRATIGYLLMAFGAKILNRRIGIKDVAYDLRRLDFYDNCDFHIGYRVHAHLYFLSKRLPSVLINEDGRGKGMVETMNLPVFNIDDENLVQKVDEELSRYKQTNFSSFQIVGEYIDNQFEVMKKFLATLT